MNELDVLRKEIDSIDTDIVSSFVLRMDTVKRIAEYKKKNRIPVSDSNRENDIIDRHTCSVPAEYRSEFHKYYSDLINISKRLQNKLIDDAISVTTSLGSYDIVISRGSIKCINMFFDLDRKVLVITDSGVPKEYTDAVISQCNSKYCYVIEQGEQSKSRDTVFGIIDYMIDNCFDRSDCIVSVGGGVVSDIAGFVASVYQRGIDYFSIPTTLLSMVDASVGGKNGFDYSGYKNQIGTYYQPKCILIDPDTLTSLPKRHFSNGLVESLKMAMTHDRDMFDIFAKGNETARIDEIIKRSVLIKKSVIEMDLFDAEERKSLNFGHTIGHAIESLDGFKNMLHGECVAIGIMTVSNDEIRRQLIPIFSRLGIPYSCDVNADEICDFIKHDKKAVNNQVAEVFVKEAGSYEIKYINISDYRNYFVK